MYELNAYDGRSEESYSRQSEQEREWLTTDYE